MTYLGIMLHHSLIPLDLFVVVIFLIAYFFVVYIILDIHDDYLVNDLSKMTPIVTVMLYKINYTSLIILLTYLPYMLKNNQ